MAEPTFVINGKEYPIHGMETFDLGEAMVLFEYSKLTLDQIEDVEGLHPGVVAAQMHVSIARDNPGMKAKDIKEMVTSANLVAIVESLAASMQEDDADVPPSEPLPSESVSTFSSDESEPSSGESSGIVGDDLQERNLRAIGNLG